MRALMLAEDKAKSRRIFDMSFRAEIRESKAGGDSNALMRQNLSQGNVRFLQ
jgi:hypothetical protein